MGGSRSYSISKFKSGGKISGSPGNSKYIVKAVQSGIENEIVSQAIGAIISYHNPLNTLIYGLKFVKLAYEMYCAGQETYEKTGDGGEAIIAASKVVIDKTISNLKNEGISLAVSSIISQESIGLDDSTKSIIADGLSSVIEGAFT